MRTIFIYKGESYGYRIVGGEVVTFKIEKNICEDGMTLDEEVWEQLESEFKVYEATLTEKEMRIWRGE